MANNITKEDICRSIRILAEFGNRCGCECHAGKGCKFAENIGNSVCIPLLARIFVQYQDMELQQNDR